ncbi:hypothetical protein PUMCH_001950 [Australozyma saopauloensis]|uniref:GrpE protein homolog, mitochondrial n=1 Tax=Australozyma saopauloensis TaxID=291208 RepID=A0AAX4H7X7_9ASCO|nr:hypothetical protein PUMCH_001950 [[Candida] saopauloensis]
MQRAIYNSLVKSVPRAAVSLRAAPRSSVLAFQPFTGVRFNSTKAEPEVKATEKEAAAETGANENASEATEAAEEKSQETILQEKLAEKDKALAEMKNHYAQAIADFRNLQQITTQEVKKAKDFALQKFAKDLLESLDNFTLALGSVQEETLKANEEVKNLFDGVSMTRNVLEKTLERHGIEKIDPMGEQFDPNQHEATFEVPQADKEPGTVFHVQQLGYTLNKRVLRPAKVGLVKDVEN